LNDILPTAYMPCSHYGIMIGVKFNETHSTIVWCSCASSFDHLCQYSALTPQEQICRLVVLSILSYSVLIFLSVCLSVVHRHS